MFSNIMKYLKISHDNNYTQRAINRNINSFVFYEKKQVTELSRGMFITLLQLEFNYWAVQFPNYCKHDFAGVS